MGSHCELPELLVVLVPDEPRRRHADDFALERHDARPGHVGRELLQEGGNPIRLRH